MEPHVQLIFNVVVITGATSLAAICYFLKLDNEKLAVQLQVWRERVCREKEPGQSKIAIAHPAPVHAAPYSPDRPRVSAIKQTEPAPASVAATDQDIREYVAQRSNDWSALPIPGNQLHKQLRSR